MLAHILISVSPRALASDQYAINSTMSILGQRCHFHSPHGLHSWGSINARSSVEMPKIQGQGLGTEVSVAYGSRLIVIGQPKNKSTLSVAQSEGHTTRGIEEDMVWDYVLLNAGSSM